MNRDRIRQHAAPTRRARRIADAARREDELRRRGIDPDDYERARLETTRVHRLGRTRAPRERRRAPIGRILKIGLLLVVILAVVGGVLLFQRVSRFNDAVSSAGTVSSALFGPLNGQDRVNVLLIGYGGETQAGGAGFLADSMNIYSIDPATDTTTVIPVPRDFWVEGFPDILPENGKLNEVFAVGHLRGGIEEGARATAEVLSGVTGLRIDHWMAMDFLGFREMVDAVGGVTVQNPTAFEYTWIEERWLAGNFDGGSFAAGTLHLDGDQALSYARARYTSVVSESSDFARSVRQQRIMGALRSKLGDGGLSSFGPGLSLMDALEGRLETDLSAIDLFLLSGHLGIDRRIELTEDVILQATRNTIGQYILVVIGRATPDDYTPLHRWLAERLAEPIEPAASASATPATGG
ncbi:MAG TPA: LCP family protein [Candidatus Limnocylindria bacterium]|nr:LCP family protein [Candidatus Limnocylindria bacterium]